MSTPTIPRHVITDDRARAVLTGHPNTLYTITEQPDGSILLVPASIVTDAQREYDNDHELQDHLGRAMNSPTVQRQR